MRNKRFLLGMSLLLAGIGIGGCSSEEDAPTDFADQLEQDTGTPWTVYRDPRSQEVRFVAPKKPIALDGATPEEKARSFFAKYRDALHATGAADELQIQSTAKDNRGGTHLRFGHVLPGTSLPVFDSGTTAHFNENGEAYWFETDFLADLSGIDGHAKVTPEEASAKGLAHVASVCGTVFEKPTTAPPELGVFADPGKPSALAFRVMMTLESAGCHAPSVYVDAKNGNVLSLEERAHSIDALVRGSRGELLQDPSDRKVISVTAVPQPLGTKYQMITEEPPHTRVITTRFGSHRPIESDHLFDWDVKSKARGAAVDAHHYTQQALGFLRKFPSQYESHLRTYVYPLSRDVHVTVHVNTESNNNGANAGALYIPWLDRDQIEFGDGNFPAVANALPFSAAYDVVAHEVAHLVTEHTSKLHYSGESGALNESFSDAMGAAAEHALFGPNVGGDRREILIGEGLYFPGKPGPSALRSMSDPQRYGHPDHKDLQKKCFEAPTDDNCHVHTNSGIPNKAFSLIVSGGTVRNRRVKDQKDTLRPLGVPQGIGWEEASEITYWATTGLNATATFANAAFAQEAEAGRFLLSHPAAVHTVRCAWYSVGVHPVANVADEWYTKTFCDASGQSAPETPPSPPSPVDALCVGRPDGSLLCDPSFPAQALLCRNGRATTELCADTEMKCKPASATDPTATTDANNSLICE